MTWSFDNSWQAYPRTPAIDVVRQALDQGLAGAAAVAYIRAHSTIPIGIGGAGVWPAENLQWYGKGSPYAYDGKFQWVGVPDGPYFDGWEIKWDATSWVYGTAPDGVPVGADGKHPTRWMLAPLGVVDLAPPPAPPAPPPPAPPAPGPGLEPEPDELGQLIQDVERIAAGIDTIAATLVALLERVDDVSKRGLIWRLR